MDTEKPSIEFYAETDTVCKFHNFLSDGGTANNKITNSLVYMICKDNLPLNTPEKQGFQHFMKTVTPLYTIPGRKTITKIIDEKYNVLFHIMKSKLAEIEVVTLTTDIWTDTINTKSYLGVTCHFFDFDKLSLKSIILKVHLLDENHTSEYIGQCLRQILIEWAIPLDKVTAVVTDNGNNIVKAVSDLFTKNKHLPCFAHTLDLVACRVTYGNYLIKPIIEKVKSIVTFFKQSVVSADQLRKSQPENNILKLTQCVPTRWNSVFYMLERFILLHKYVTPIVLSNPKAPIMVTAAELEEVKDAIHILKPIEAVSKELSGEKYITCSKIIPMVHCLMQTLKNMTSLTTSGETLKQLTIEELNKRFGNVEKNKLLAVSTILDPRLKKATFSKSGVFHKHLLL